MFKKILEIVAKERESLSTKILIKIIYWKYFNQPKKLLNNFKAKKKGGVFEKILEIVAKRKDSSLQQKF